MAKSCTTSMLAPLSSANRSPFARTRAQCGDTVIAIRREDILFEDGVENQGKVESGHGRLHCSTGFD